MQCLNGEDPKSVRSIVLTASGGALRDVPIEKLHKVTAREALNHPVWNMGKKVTIDSATLFNKGLEVIEAMHLSRLLPKNQSSDASRKHNSRHGRIHRR